MSIGGKLIGALLVSGAAVAGGYVGEGLKDGGGTSMDTQKMLTNAAPGVVLALIAGWPRTLYAFLGGMISGIMMDKIGSLGQVGITFGEDNRTPGWQ